jgi:hypothetical protein
LVPSQPPKQNRSTQNGRGANTKNNREKPNYAVFDYHSQPRRLFRALPDHPNKTNNYYCFQNQTAANRRPCRFWTSICHSIPVMPRPVMVLNEYLEFSCIARIPQLYSEYVPFVVREPEVAVFFCLFVCPSFGHTHHEIIIIHPAHRVVASIFETTTNDHFRNNNDYDPNDTFMA